ncbi:MAG: UvrD-helicase domain-containing protein [Sandaracinaceae bacterium]|nr:UvrD-helicase domain-containing protein [Sandaracinaceae bacterium]
MNSSCKVSASPLARAFQALSERRHLVIEASAGTGKTYTLEQLICWLLKEVDPEKILVVTFTDKATHEMRRRIRGRLYAGGSSKHQAAFEKVSISTIHAFCRRLLMEYSLQEGRLGFEIVPNSLPLLFREALARVIEKHLIPGRPGAQALASAFGLIAGDLNSHNAKSEIQKMYRWMSIPPERRKPHFEAQAVAQALLNWCSSDGGIKNAFDGQELSELESLLARSATQQELLDWPGWRQAFKLFKEHKRSLQKKKFYPTLMRAFGSYLPFLSETLLPRVKEEIQRIVQEKGEVDYDYLLIRAAELIEDPIKLKEIREKYEYALIDEFQDTDELQWKIFRSIFVDSTEQRHSLTIIGDAKQSIYGFRSADVHIFEKAKEELIALNAEYIELDTNYRTDECLLDGLDHIFKANCGGCTSGLAGYKKKPSAARGRQTIKQVENNSEIELEPIVIVRSNENKKLLEWMCYEIQNLVSGDFYFSSNCQNEKRSIEYKDIFVLAQKRSEINEIAKAFEKHRIPYLIHRESGIFQRMEALWMCELLEAIAYPHDRSSVARALAGPFFGFSLAQLPTLRTLGPEDEALQRLHNWAELALQGRYPALFASIFEEAPLPPQSLNICRQIADRLLAWTSERLMMPEEVFARLAKAIDGRDAAEEDHIAREGGQNAVSLLTMHKSKGLEAEIVFIYALPSFAYYHSDQIKTFHEVEEHTNKTSIVAWAFDSPVDTVWLKNEKGPISVKEAYKRETIMESERLLYVAMTRAKRRLYLPFFTELQEENEQKGKNNRGGVYAILHERLQALFKQNQNGFNGSPIFKQIDISSGTIGPKKVDFHSAGPQEDFKRERLSDDEIERIFEKHAGFERLSYSQIKSRLQKSTQKTLAPSIEIFSDEIEDTSRDGAFVGRLTHQLIEFVLNRRRLDPCDFQSFKEDSEIQRLSQGIWLDEAGVNEAIALAHRALYTTTDLFGSSETFASFLKNKPFSAEMPFAFSIADPNGTHLIMKGVFDLMFFDGSAYHIVDWKTDHLPSWDAQKLIDHVKHEYALQAAIYAIASWRIVPKQVGSVIYVFLRDPQKLHWVKLSPSPEVLEQWEELFAASKAAQIELEKGVSVCAE